MAVTANNFLKENSLDTLDSEDGASDSDTEEFEYDPFKIIFDNNLALADKISKSMLNSTDLRGNTLLTLAGKLCK